MSEEWTGENMIEITERKLYELEKDLKACREHLAVSIAKECKCENVDEVNRVMLGENIRLRAQNKILQQNVLDFQSRYSAVLANNKLMKPCVDFYADKGNWWWESYGDKDHLNCINDDMEKIDTKERCRGYEMVGGKKAREALKIITKKQHNLVSKCS